MKYKLELEKTNKFRYYDLINLYIIKWASLLESPWVIPLGRPLIFFSPNEAIHSANKNHLNYNMAHIQH